MFQETRPRSAERASGENKRKQRQLSQLAKRPAPDSIASRLDFLLWKPSLEAGDHCVHPGREPFPVRPIQRSFNSRQELRIQFRQALLDLGGAAAQAFDPFYPFFSIGQLFRQAS